MMITTRRTTAVRHTRARGMFEPTIPPTPPLIHPATEAAATLALDGPVPTWRPTEEPIYLEMVQRYGVPGTGISGGPVVRGEVVS